MEHLYYVSLSLSLSFTLCFFPLRQDEHSPLLCLSNVLAATRGPLRLTSQEKVPHALGFYYLVKCLQ